MNNPLKRNPTNNAPDNNPDSANDGNTVPDPAELKQRLSAIQYDVTQNSGTERAFTGEYWDTKTEGTYECVVCGEELFSSDTKFDSGTGWPSFYAAVESGKVDRHTDRKFGMKRVEARCAKCDSHLGHIFSDGPLPTGERFCMNSASLNLKPADPAD